MSTHSLCFEQEYEKYLFFCLKIFLFLVVKFSIYLNRHVFVMDGSVYRIRSVKCEVSKRSPYSLTSAATSFFVHFRVFLSCSSFSIDNYLFRLIGKIRYLKMTNLKIKCE